jgi:hypothetical protein
MLTEVENHPSESTASIVSGIVDDLRELVKKEFRLAQEEVKDDLRKARDASILWVAGVGVLCLSAIPIVFMLASLLHTLTSPAGSDPASLPMWGCYGIVAVFLAIVGFITMSMGQKRFETVSELVDKQIRQVTEEPNHG